MKMYDTFDNHSNSNVVAFAFGNNESGAPSIVMDNITLSESSNHIPNIENLPTYVSGKDYKDIIHHILKHFDDKQDILNIAIVLNQVAEVYDKRCAESAFTGGSEKKFRPTSPLVLQHDECRTTQTREAPLETIYPKKTQAAGAVKITTRSYLNNLKDVPPEALEIQEERDNSGNDPATTDYYFGDILSTCSLDITYTNGYAVDDHNLGDSHYPWENLNETVIESGEPTFELPLDTRVIIHTDDNPIPSSISLPYDGHRIIVKNDDVPTSVVADYVNHPADVILRENGVQIPTRDNQVHTPFRRHEFVGDSPTALRLRALWNEIEGLRPRRNQHTTENNDELEARATIRRDEFQDKDIGGQGGRNQRNDFLRLVLQYRDHLYAALDYGHLARVSEKREGQVLLLDFILSNGGRVLRYHSKSSQFYVANPYEALEIMAAKMRDGRLNINR